MNRPQRIVIVGAGFGGIYAYLELHKRFHETGDIAVTLINESDEFVFVPMIHEVATGTLLPSSVTNAIRNIPWCCIDEFVRGRATSFDFGKKRVRVEYHGPDATSLKESQTHHHHTDVEYDYLVLAMGSEARFFGVPGAREHALPLKTLNDAKRLKNHIIDRFEEASRLADPDAIARELQFVIVGGGPTGVELAGELSDLFAGEMLRAFPKVARKARVLLVEGGDTLVKAADPWFGTRIQAKLEASPHVYLLFNTRATEVTPEGVHLGEEFAPCKTVIWSGGVRARAIDAHGGHFDTDERSGRMAVTPELHLPHHPPVYVVGDQALVHDKSNDAPYPMRAQFASRQGTIAGRNIASAIRGTEQEAFAWREQGFIVSLGKGGAFADVFGYKLSGWPAWFLYRTAYLVKTFGWRAKLRMALEWTLNVFLPRDISKL